VFVGKVEYRMQQLRAGFERLEVVAGVRAHVGPAGGSVSDEGSGGRPTPRPRFVRLVAADCTRQRGRDSKSWERIVVGDEIQSCWRLSAEAAIWQTGQTGEQEGERERGEGRGQQSELYSIPCGRSFQTESPPPLPDHITIE
jgi:hypothetical protein